MSELVPIRRYRDLSEAIVPRPPIESSGITTYFYDENLVRLDWQISNFIEGIRLRVESTDEPESTELLNQAVPDFIEFGAAEAYQQALLSSMLFNKPHFSRAITKSGLDIAVSFLLASATGPRDVAL